METTYHYAVWKSSDPYMSPACISRIELEYTGGEHGITIIRGHVNCSDCKRMMGMPTTI